MVRYIANDTSRSAIYWCLRKVEAGDIIQEGDVEYTPTEFAEKYNLSTIFKLINENAVDRENISCPEFKIIMDCNPSLEIDEYFLVSCKAEPTDEVMKIITREILIEFLWNDIRFDTDVEIVYSEKIIHTNLIQLIKKSGLANHAKSLVEEYMRVTFV